MSRCRMPAACAASRPPMMSSTASTASAGVSGPSRRRDPSACRRQRLHRDDRHARDFLAAEDVDRVRMTDRGGELTLAQKPRALVGDPAAVCAALSARRAGRARGAPPRRLRPSRRGRADGRCGTARRSVQRPGVGPVPPPAGANDSAVTSSIGSRTVAVHRRSHQACRTQSFGRVRRQFGAAPGAAARSRRVVHGSPLLTSYKWTSIGYWRERRLSEPAVSAGARSSDT